LAPQRSATGLHYGARHCHAIDLAGVGLEGKSPQ
jgi:hypothetical protein